MSCLQPGFERLMERIEIPLVDLKIQYRRIQDQIDEAIQSVVGQASFIGGSVVRDFEREFARLCGVDHCIGVGSGTDALCLSLWAAGVGEGDEVIVPANSFIATSAAVTTVRAQIKFVDIDPNTYTLDVAAVKKAVTSQTKAIIPVHLYGQPADMNAVLKIAQQHGLLVIEDAAQAHYAEYEGRPVGSLGALGCFSFYPGKNLGAYGDAGAVVTHDQKYAEKIRMRANHGRKDKYNHAMEGINSRLDGLQAAVLRVKIRYIRRWNKWRSQAAALYTRLLADVKEVETPTEKENSRHVYHLYVVRARNRNNLQSHLKVRGVSTGIHYPVPLPELEAYDYLGHKPEDFPVSSAYAGRVLSLPMFPEITDGQILYVVDKIKQFYS